MWGQHDQANSQERKASGSVLSWLLELSCLPRDKATVVKSAVAIHSASVRLRGERHDVEQEGGQARERLSIRKARQRKRRWILESCGGCSFLIPPCTSIAWEGVDFEGRGRCVRHDPPLSDGTPDRVDGSRCLTPDMASSPACRPRTSRSLRTRNMASGIRLWCRLFGCRIHWSRRLAHVVEKTCAPREQMHCALVDLLRHRRRQLGRVDGLARIGCGDVRDQGCGKSDQH